MPESTVCLLSPQHWDQSAQDHFPKKDGIWCSTASEECTLYWDQERFKRTLRYNPIANVARFCSTLGTINYQMIAAYMEADLGMEENECISFNTVLISDEEEESFEHDASPMRDKLSVKENIINFLDENELPILPLNKVSVADEKELPAMTLHGELLR
eukprot:15365711-Ditylum_brightwellii.AAC.2